MAKWNPGAISTVGNEWRAWSYSGDRQEPVAALVRSTANETVDSILMPYTASGSLTVPNYGKVWAEIYDAANLGLNETPTTQVYLPNEDTSVSLMYYRAIGGAVTGPISNTASDLEQYINDLTDEAYGNADYVTVATGGHARFAFNTASLPAGRVLSVAVEIRYESRSNSTGQIGVDLYNGTGFVQRLFTLNSQPTGQNPPAVSTVNVELPANPVTQEPWTRADVIGMDSAVNLLLQLTNITGSLSVYALRVKVKMISEKRLAVGANALTTTTTAGNVNTTNFCILKTPAGADNWAKAASTNYLVVMRRLTDPSYAMPPQEQYYWRVDSGAVNPENQGHGYVVTMDQYGRLITAVGPETAAYGVLMAKTTGALSVDSQPYWQLRTASVYSGVTANQRMTGHGTTIYQTIRATVGVLTSAALRPTANLTFQIKRVSDNVVMGGTGTLIPSHIAEHPLLGVFGDKSWYDVQLDLTVNASLVAATAYYVEMVSTTPSDKAWFLQALDESYGHIFSDDQSYGGTTGYALVNGASETEMDLALTMTVPPPAGPGAITVTVVSYALPDNGGAMCASGSHQAARVAWTTTAEGPLFAHYEIQRSEDNGVNWATIKRVLTESTLTFDDVTAARGVTLKYRVRTMRTNGQASTWRTQGSTVTLAVNVEAVVFATNEDPTLTTGYVWLNPRHEYEWLADREVNVVQLHNRDYNVVFRGTEDRGALFRFDLLIYARGAESDCGGTPPDGKGDAAFASLREVIESAGPSVAVFTPFGRRIYGGARIARGGLDGETALYATTVSVVEVASADAVTELV